MEKLTEKDLQYITGQLTFAKLDNRLLFTPYGEEVLEKLYKIRQGGNGGKTNGK